MSTCYTCKHFQPNTSFISFEKRLIHGHCRHPKAQTVHLVTSKIYYKYAEDMRYYNGPCGVQGHLYEKEGSVLKIVMRAVSVYDMINALFATIFIACVYTAFFA